MRNLIFSLLFLCAAMHGQVKAQERQWSLDAAAEDVFLVFGVPETDDVGVSFWCKINSGQVRIYVPEGSASLKPDQTTSINIGINGAEYILQGKTTENQATGQTSVEMDIAANSPLIASLQSAEHFSITIANHKVITPLLDADISGLLKLCGLATL